MRSLLLASGAVVLLGGTLFADTIYAPASTGASINITGVTAATFISNSPVYSASAPGVVNGFAFWNNPSVDGVSPALQDGHNANIGDVLAGLATGTNEIGTANLAGTPSNVTPNTGTSINGSYYAMAGGTDPISAVTGTSATPGLEFKFVSTQTAQTLSLLFADSGNDSGNNCSPLSPSCTNTTGATVIGTYIMMGGVVTPTTVIDGNVGDLTSGVAKPLTGTSTGIGPSNPADLVANAGTVYGYYATVCYQVTAGVCTESITYTTGDGNFSSGFAAGAQLLGALGWNHFALFQLADGTEVLGFTDTPYSLATNVQAQGDFNDIVLAISGNPAIVSPSPEPGTIAIMGLGLAALGVIRRRTAKK